MPARQVPWYLLAPTPLKFDSDAAQRASFEGPLASRRHRQARRRREPIKGGFVCSQFRMSLRPIQATGLHRQPARSVRRIRRPARRQCRSPRTPASAQSLGAPATLWSLPGFRVQAFDSLGVSGRRHRLSHIEPPLFRKGLRGTTSGSGDSSLRSPAEYWFSKWNSGKVASILSPGGRG